MSDHPENYFTLLIQFLYSFKKQRLLSSLGRIFAKNVFISGGDAAIVDFDEGFSSSSDEEDLEDDDESGTSEGIGSLNVEDSKDGRGDNP